MKDRLLGHLASIKDRVANLPVLRNLIRAYSRADGLRFMRWAAAIALFAYLSVFPLLVLGFMAFAAALQHFPGVQADVEAFLKESMPLLFDPLQASSQKIDLQSLLTDLPLQFSHPAFLGPPLAHPGKAFFQFSRRSRLQRCSTLGFNSQARATSATEAPNSSRRTTSALNSAVNFLRDKPMARSSIQ